MVPETYPMNTNINNIAVRKYSAFGDFVVFLLRSECALKCLDNAGIIDTSDVIVMIGKT